MVIDEKGRQVTHILIVDDEENLRHTVGYNLRRVGYQVEDAADGEGALAAIRARQPDLVILDIMLPGIDGFEVCRRLRAANNVPVLMLTARDSELDRVVGLEIGGDDYLVKPFSMPELLARVKAMLRRATFDRSPSSDSTPIRIEAGSLVIDVITRTVSVGSSEITLKPREYELIAFMARRPGQVFTREQLLEHVWGYAYSGDTRTVDVHVRSLREKLGDRADRPQWIETVWSVGYRFRATTDR